MDRILALDLRARRYGYAVLDSARQLLGWGYRRRGISKDDSARRHLSNLAARFNFQRIVARRSPKTRVSKNYGALLHDVLEFAKLSRLPIHFIDPNPICQFFGGRNKFQIANTLAERFPETRLRLPKERRIWRPESESQSLFDALAAALCFLESAPN